MPSSPRALSKRQLSTLRRRVYSANYRAMREYGREEMLKVDEILHLLETENNCRYCGKRLTAGTFSIDHIIPLVDGGANSLDNVTLSCRRDNRYKGALPANRYFEFLQWLDKGGFLQLFFSQYRPHSYRHR